MKRLCLLVSCGLLCLAAIAIDPSPAAEPKAKSWTAGAIADDGKATPAVKPAAVAEKGEKGERLGFFERRRLGLTIAKVRPVVERLAAEGKIDRDNPSAAAAAVMQELMREDPKAWGEVQLDFDAILEFLERLIPLIMKLIDLFSWLPSLPSASPAAAVIALAFPAMPPAWRRAA